MKVDVRTILAAGAVTAAGLFASACKTTPSQEADRTALVDRSSSTLEWFKSNVSGLSGQLRDAGGYVVFPDVGQAGFIVGGTSGRGVVFDARGNQVGWARLSTGSIGLQAGARGFRMLMILQNEQAMNEFRNNRWSGTASAVAVAGGAGGSGLAEFRNGVAVYQGASSGLMAGVDVGLNNVRFEPLN